MEYPDSEDLTEELFTELARASGHTNRVEVWNYYPTPTEMGAGTADGVKVWPSVETLKMKPGELWPLYQTFQSHSRNNNKGRSDTEFFIILPRSNIDNLLASAKFK
jgi:hypothetical protein